MTEQRHTTMVTDPQADLFREAKDTLVLLEYLDNRYRTLGGQFPHYRADGAEALARLQGIVAKMLGTLFLDGAGKQQLAPDDARRTTFKMSDKPRWPDAQ